MNQRAKNQVSHSRILESGRNTLLTYQVAVLKSGVDCQRGRVLRQNFRWKIQVFCFGPHHTVINPLPPEAATSPSLARSGKQASLASLARFLCSMQKCSKHIFTDRSIDSTNHERGLEQEEFQIRGFQILWLLQIVKGCSNTSWMVPYYPNLNVDLKLWIFPTFGICRQEYQEENDCKGRIFCKISTEQREIFRKHQRTLSNSFYSLN